MAARVNSLPPHLLSNFQIIHSRVRDLDDSKKKILVLHDLAGDPEVQHLRDGGWKKFDKLVFVSHWQKQQYQDYLGVPPSAGTVLKNAIEPAHPHAKPNDKIRLMYYSTPHRGLDILFAVFKPLAEEFPNIELNVFSSFDLYGWEQRDEPYKQLFKELSEHPQVNYSKSVSNERIRQELERSHILAYPSTWPETSCLVLIEAMCHGLACVHSSLAALPETGLNLTHMYDFHEVPNEHAKTFYIALRNAILTYESQSQQRQTQAAIANAVYNWEYRKTQWENLLQSLL